MQFSIFAFEMIHMDATQCQFRKKCVTSSECDLDQWKRCVQVQHKKQEICGLGNLESAEQGPGSLSTDLLPPLLQFGPMQNSHLLYSTRPLVFDSSLLLLQLQEVQSSCTESLSTDENIT